FLQTIRTRTRPFAEYWGQVSEAYHTGKAADDVSDDGDKRGRGKRGAGAEARAKKAKTAEQLAEELDALVFTHLDNLLEVSASWSRTFLESYYGVAREFARELETILGECITMCDRRAQGLKYPPPLSLEPQLTRARSAIACLQPQLEGRIERIQQVVRDRNGEIFAATEELRTVWVETSGATVQTKMARAAHKDFKKRMRRIEYQQQTGVIGWAMRELEHLLTASDVAAVVTDCLELLMTEAEILERAVGQVFVRKLEPTTEDLREQRQDIIDDFTEGLLTGREELAGIVGKLMLKEAWRILESNISLQRQKLLLDNGRGGGGGKSKKKAQAPAAAAAAASQASSAAAVHPEPVAIADIDDVDALNDDGGVDSAGKKRKKNKKNKKKKGKKGAAKAAQALTTPTHDEYDDEEELGHDDEDEGDVVRDPQNPFATLTWAENDDGSVTVVDVKPGADKNSKVVVLQQNMPPVANETDESGAKHAFPAEDKQAESAVSIDTESVAAANNSDSVSTREPEEGRTRSRRGTNAARYVPGVGFVSDDGVSATSPQLLSSSGTFKAGLRGTAVKASGRMSPMGAARLGTSRPQSPLVTAGRPVSALSGTANSNSGSNPALSGNTNSNLAQSGNTNSNLAVLDAEQLANVQSMLLSGPAEAMEHIVSGLAHENVVSLAMAALSERRRVADEAAGWHASVSSVLQTYDAISAQLDAFRGLCEAHDAEAARLTSLLSQAAQSAQEWHERHDHVAEELRQLKARSGAGDAGDAKDAWPSQQQQQQQMSMFGGAQFGFQYPGGVPASFMGNPSFAAPMMFSGPGSQPMGSAAEATEASSSASLLTALNAGSQPF
ncbi:hypothetical protein IWW50_004704, partial [Coemansia erecta]